MFDHPEGQPHPKPPTHQKKFKLISFDGDLNSESAMKIESYFNSKGLYNKKSKLSLQKIILDYVYDKDNRSSYVDFAINHLKNKKIDKEKLYDIIIIGAGIHAAVYIYNLKKNYPSINVLVIEKSNTVSSTFSILGDSLVLNSPTFSKVGLNSNIIPGHFIQISDFDELSEKPFPTAKHLYELTTMVLFHSGADILFEFQAEKIDRYKNYYEVRCLKKMDTCLKAKNIIVANGLGEVKTNSFSKDKISSKLFYGDEFISRFNIDRLFIKKLEGKNVAVVGAGDTANCVMEYILPLVYPNYYYGFYKDSPALPKKIYWVGQNSKTIQDYFFSNKSRYCHSGGVIEFFWDQESPFELSTEIWKKTKDSIQCVSEKLKSITHENNKVLLHTQKSLLEVDFLIDCTGRANELSSSLLKRKYDFVLGDILFFGGYWCEKLEKFIPDTRKLNSKKIASKLYGEYIFFLGNSGPTNELIEDNEAKNGSLKYQEERTSLTNSKWSLEHTLPRTVSFAGCIKHLR